MDSPFFMMYPMKSTILLCSIIFSIAGLTLGQSSGKKSLKYLNQEPPGLVPLIFAPGLVSLQDQHEFGSTFSTDGEEFYYGVDIKGKAETRFMKLKNKVWTTPEKFLFSEKYSYNDPFLSPDESKLFFISDMPLNGVGEKKDYDLWYVKRNGNSWSKPINAGRAINSDKDEYYISFTKNGTLYFSSNAKTNESSKWNFDIYASKEKGEFQEPVRLSDSINTQGYEADVFVAYDESYLIFCAERPESYGKGDLYISFKKADGTWTTAKNMGNAINTKEYELCPFVSRDGKYFFYSSNKDIYWVDARIINQLR